MTALHQAATALEAVCVENGPRATIDSLLDDVGQLLQPQLAEPPVSTDI